MFDNIIGQKKTITTLVSEIKTGRLPPAILFYGQPHTGKLSAALETARVLCCERDAGWSCPCHSCKMHRLLLHPSLLLLGFRDFSVEISASAHVFEQTKTISTRFLFLRAVRKLLKRFDPVLWGEENTKIKRVRSSIQEIEEFLDILAEKKDFTLDFPHKKLKEIVLLCQKISVDVKTNNIPIDHIRKAIYWVHLSTSQKNKIIIIEQADKMLDSSRNSLLKLLEEPPKNVFIILLTTRRGAIIQTILSRLRPYHFAERSREEIKKILKKIFKDETDDFESLREYFMSWQNMNPMILKSLAHKYIELVLSEDTHGTDILEEMSELFAMGQEKTALISFAEELTHVFQKVLHKVYFEHLGFEQIERWGNILRDSVREYELLNLNPKNVIESLFYKMKALV
ncbi:MAG: hypothetical protein JXJ04_18155 [Spirochaetales bacterium]|nr:hypothetical protein [Spirochaetales bacterium]